jgi:DNA-binding PadR family transcriptional regulator
MLRYVLLALMADGRPVHGYALMKAFAAHSGVRLGVGNVYRELQRLRAGGLVAAASNPAGADPRRVPHSITDAGRSVLKRWIGRPAESFVRESVDALCYRLALVDKFGEQGGFLDDLQAELQLLRRSMERQRAAVTFRDDEGADGAPMLPILIGRRAKHLAADLEVIEEVRAALSAPKQPPPTVEHGPARPRRKAAREGKPTAANRRVDGTLPEVHSRPR